jgi:hypothetical protein
MGFPPSSTRWTSLAAMRDAMTAGGNTFSGLAKICCIVTELAGLRIRIWSAWVRQRVLSVRVKVCSSSSGGILDGVNTGLDGVLYRDGGG